MGELPTGFRFYPTEEELISFYLHNKLQGTRHLNLERVIPVLDIYELEPSDLPQFAGELCRGDPEQWFFFAPRQEREARGGRPNRTTASGYWKATGSPSYVLSSPSINNNGGVLGMKKTMVFYRGKAPNGRKTKWRMNEYKAIEGTAPTSTDAIPTLRHEFSLCRVYINTGRLRSFDRRPPPLPPPQPPAAAATSMAHDHHHHEDRVYNSQSYNSSSSTATTGTTTGYQLPSTATEVTDQTEEAGDWDVAEDLRLLSELEQLDSLYLHS